MKSSVFAAFTMLIAISGMLTAGQGNPIKFPESTHKYVNDFAGILSRAQKDSLVVLSSSIQKVTSAQVIILITNNVPENYDLGQYAYEIAHQWGIGQDQYDNGVLIFVCPSCRKSAIEVGYGLEGVLTDAFTKRLQADQFNPHFRTGDFYTGLWKGLHVLQKSIVKDFKRSDHNKTSQSETHTGPRIPIVFLSVLIVMLALIGGLYYYVVIEEAKGAVELFKSTFHNVIRQLRVAGDENFMLDIEALENYYQETMALLSITPKRKQHSFCAGRTYFLENKLNNLLPPQNSQIQKGIILGRINQKLTSEDIVIVSSISDSTSAHIASEDHTPHDHTIDNDTSFNDGDFGGGGSSNEW